jgi:hypothetical protein
MDEKGNSVALSVLIDHLNGWTIFVPFSIINIRGRIFAQMSNKALETREEAKREKRKAPPRVRVRHPVRAASAFPRSKVTVLIYGIYTRCSYI